MSYEMSLLWRPKSAPVRDVDVELKSGRRNSRHELRSVSRNEDRRPETLEETVNNFHTTSRLQERQRERRRTEHELNVIETPSGQLANEIPGRRLSRVELDNVLTRVTQPTASYSARVASNRRRESKDIYVPPKTRESRSKRFDENRFKGGHTLSDRAMKSLVDRLSSFNVERKPPDSRRSMSPDVRQRMGSLSSYRWRGLKNC